MTTLFFITVWPSGGLAVFQAAPAEAAGSRRKTGNS